MPNTSTAKTLDVERSAIVRLKLMAQDRLQTAFQGKSDAAHLWWDGYLRAIEQILDMENE